MSKEQTAINPTREKDYPEWYQQVIKASDMAENSPTRGCMIIKPWGYGIWETLQSELDQRIKETGHENAYFPLLIPLSFLEKEAEHVNGFAKECAVVTHHRLKAVDGKLVPEGKLEEPYVIRPTSETIIGDAFSRWIKSYRDLPVLINQWANVFRWELRTRLFLRTAEFLWQEGHTAHATEEDARKEAMLAFDMYRDFVEDVLAMPVICGEKPAHERFAGAVNTYSIEAMMQDRKALQAGTSHYLGTNFATAQSIQYLDKDGEQKFCHTTSWGMSTRLIGGIVMVHSDDNGLRVPPKVSPKHIVIIPVIPKEDQSAAVMEYAESIYAELRELTYNGSKLKVHFDKRDIKGGEKNWSWIKKGIPLRIEVGPRDIESKKVVLYRRDEEPGQKHFMTVEELKGSIISMLDQIQKNYFDQASNYLREHTYTNIKTLEEFTAFFTPKNIDKPEIHGGFVRAKWCMDPASLDIIDKLKVSIRNIPFDQSGTEGSCILTGRPATTEVIFAKSY